MPGPSTPVVSLMAGLLCVALATASLGVAQTSVAGRTVWDGAYTDAQAERGAKAYDQSCSRCHALASEGRSPLVGDPFWKSFSQKSVGEVLEFVSTYMPNGAAGSLDQPTYADIVATMLKSNGFPAGTTELGPMTNAEVLIVPKDGSTKLPANALATVVGCLGRSGEDWVVTSATNPTRAERGVSPVEAETLSLGKRELALKFVLTNLSSFVGSRVLVTGILIGDDGVDGINVTSVNRVAAACP